MLTDAANMRFAACPENLLRLFGFQKTFRKPYTTCPASADKLKNFHDNNLHQCQTHHHGPVAPTQVKTSVECVGQWRH